jgi:hypothetical protein
MINNNITIMIIHDALLYYSFGVMKFTQIITTHLRCIINVYNTYYNCNICNIQTYIRV